MFTDLTVGRSLSHRDRPIQNSRATNTLSAVAVAMEAVRIWRDGDVV